MALTVDEVASVGVRIFRGVWRVWPCWSLQRRGYTLEQITESLRGEGVDLSTPTLKSYLSRAKAAKTRRLRAPVAAPSPSQVAKALPPKEVAALTKAEAFPKTGKDAFLVKDKDSY